MRKFTSIIIFVLLGTNLFAQDSLFDISILTRHNKKSFSITVQTDGYTLIANDTLSLGNLNKGDVVKFTLKGDSVQLSALNGASGVYANVYLKAEDTAAYFSIKCNIPSLSKAYDYPSNLKVRVYQSYLLALNNVYIQQYLPGVVYAEAGGGHQLEYYKVQAIISRTYARSNGFKHKDDGFNLCDQVHCQAYRGKIIGKKNIPEAVEQTNDIVVVDEDLNLITAAFHANCGGQTANSEQVWTRSVSYLKSVRDSYCTTAPSAYWKKEISKDEWNSYLQKYKFPVNDPSCQNNCTNFEQKYRMTYLTSCNSSVNLKNVRQDLGLRSTFFSVTPSEGNKIVLTGRGFGHGVGLCQEGAMNMAKLGFTYEQILKHYFTGVSVVKYEKIKVFIER